MNIHHDLRENSYLVTYDVGHNQSGIRLDSFLSERYKKRSREQIKKAISEGLITINREQGPHLSVGRLKPATSLVSGDRVLVLSERKEEPEVNFDYRVIFEDDFLLIIDKPGNLPVHPAGRFFFNTLLVHLKTQEKNSHREFFLTHRIDRETSGILVLAKSREVCAHLSRQFANRETSKKYFAIVLGKTPAEFEVNRPMRRSETSKIDLKMEVFEGSMASKSLEMEINPILEAQTGFKTIEVRNNFSLVECYPRTGRQHQIRVHLAWAGFPIIGDKLYGLSDEDAYTFYDRTLLTSEILNKLHLPRQALHAAGIEFTHPVLGKKVKFQSELPSDLKDFFYNQSF